MDRNRWHSDGARQAWPLLVFGLVTLAGCGEKPAAEVPAETPAAEAPAPAENVIPAEQLQTGATALRGQKVTVQGVTVTSLLGTKAFWIALPNKNPFLVRTSGALPALNTSVSVSGTVAAMDPATIDAWASASEITENDRPMVEFAADYIMADAVSPAP